MGNNNLARSRTITLIVALASLSSNTLSSLLFAQLPDDPYHLAVNFGRYLHFANILSVFGFIGAVRQHALSVSIFSNYLLLDTLLSSFPRLALLSLLSGPLSSTFCSPSTSDPSSSPNSDPPTNQNTYTSLLTTPLTFTLSSPPSPPPPQSQFQSQSPTDLALQNPLLNDPFATNDFTFPFSAEGCYRIIGLAQLALVAGVIAATVLQFVGALYVREFARRLWRQEDMSDSEEGRRGRRRSRNASGWGRRGRIPVPLIVYEDVEGVVEYGVGKC